MTLSIGKHHEQFGIWHSNKVNILLYLTHHTILRERLTYHTMNIFYVLISNNVNIFIM